MRVWAQETWSVLKAEKAKLEALEVWCRRKALKISQTEKARKKKERQGFYHSEINVKYAEIEKRSVNRTPNKK